MKYIINYKIFESSHSYYVEIDNENVYFDLLNSEVKVYSKRDIISINNFAKLLDLKKEIVLHQFNKKTIEFRTKPVDLGMFMEDPDWVVTWAYILLVSRRFRIQITPVEDEYFLLSVLDMNKRGSIDVPYREKFYKCDQLDGLFYVLKRDVIDEINSNFHVDESLKRFSEMKTNSYYDVLSSEEFSNLVGLDSKEHIDSLKGVTNKLFGLLNNSSDIFKYEMCGDTAIDVLIKEDPNNPKKSLGFDINKFPPRSNIFRFPFMTIFTTDDEWFLVGIGLEHEREGISHYYRCDQIEGLFEFIKDIKETIK